MFVVVWAVYIPHLGLATDPMVERTEDLIITQHFLPEIWTIFNPS